MSKAGYFKVDRGIWDHPSFAAEPFSEREAWLWLISHAAWKPTRLRVGRVVVPLERGQFTASLRYLDEAWRWDSKSRVRRFLLRLASETLIDVHTDAAATRITICNYDKYQLSGTAGDTLAERPRTKEEDINTSKEEKRAPPTAAPSPQKPKRTQSLAPRAYTSAFEAFWAAYPKTTTTNPKAEAFDVWEQLTPEDRQTATASLPRFGENCRSQQARWPEFQPCGATVYLRKRRFEDYAATPAGSVDPEKRRSGLTALARAHFRGEWREQWGARPDEPGCTIPADVIAEARQEAGRLQ
jgi:hypothetical protein